MVCRKCNKEMSEELISEFMEPREYKFTCECGQECWKGEYYDEIWMEEE